MQAGKKLIEPLRRKEHEGISVIILCASLLLAACAPAGQTAQSPAPLPPTPQILYLTHTPALRPWRERITACAASQPQVGLRLEEIAPGSAVQADVQAARQAADALLTLGEPDQTGGFFSLLGYEDLRLVVQRVNPLSEIAQADLESLLSGQAVWHDLPGAAGYDAPLEVWGYPAGDELERSLRKVFPAWSSAVWLAPDPQAVLESVAISKGGLGFVPQSWLDAGETEVKTLRLPPETAQALRLPVTAHSPAEPQGALRALLGCVTTK